MLKRYIFYYIHFTTVKQSQKTAVPKPRNSPPLLIKELVSTLREVNSVILSKAVLTTAQRSK